MNILWKRDKVIFHFYTIGTPNWLISSWSADSIFMKYKLYRQHTFLSKLFQNSYFFTNIALSFRCSVSNTPLSSEKGIRWESGTIPVAVSFRTSSVPSFGHCLICKAGRPHEGNKSEDLPLTANVMLSGEKVSWMKSFYIPEIHWSTIPSSVIFNTKVHGTQR